MFTKKNILTHLFFLIIAVGLKRYGVTAPDLTWNMFLALVSLDFAILTHFSKNGLIKFITAVLWLFFYPNTFYMVTDIVHMHFANTVLWQRESMILFMLYVPSIFFGVMAGVESVRLIFSAFSIKSYWLKLFMISGLSLLSSFAIHIGRYARLNSWDIFTRPTVVVNEMIDVISLAALPFILGFTFIQIMVLVFSINE
ncbi:DUF1361 domain-containing protein [Streptococcus suis]|uniref:DUF1361 domain-containing protein n=1 Tax=Streptococcus suis TaxID=1307 RepID=UPI000412E166|nr:DUF1361 domain-containing protein [Streptococcus suis]HEM3170131.1 DUF1361 domain-containing protein [Streptococcus suis]HEM3547255.1 DUF1361 domain-containing protein [Streptococcus suis]HEM3558315.1 DUF1361 domain-containing protein [Streptococcus suis]HEM6504975.1 DUF1361 domain-containing protein [Streptococcus suis]